jgi:hypothetical protein
MANYTRSEIRTYIEYYLAGSTDYATQINALMDAAVEEISYRHNFRSLHGLNEATLSADAYYVSMPTDYKESIKTLWLLSATGESGVIAFKGRNWYLNRYQYIDWTSAGTGTPRVCAKIGLYLYFDTKADKDYTIRLWYQKYHQDFTTLAAGGDADAVEHLFKPNMLAVQAITAWVLTQVKQYVPLTAEGQAMAGQLEYFVQKLIAADSVHEDEPIEAGAYFDSDREGEFSGGGTVNENPYDWVT